jgi:non-haem Fe2+, alpha-ketoglutarate-dependent halogenase
MPKQLSEAERARYAADGFLFPIRVLETAEAARYRAQYEGSVARFGPFTGARTQKVHLLLTWVDTLVHDPRLLDSVEDLLGPNFLLWSTELFVKPAGTGKYISWHQDDTYWHLDPAIEITAWIALSDVPRESGPVRYIPGSHKVPRPQVELRPHPDNMLHSGQVACGADEARAVDAILGAGEVAFHDARMLHGSAPNRWTETRVGVAARFVPTYVRQLRGRESALLVRGHDAYGNFDPEPRPRADMDDAARAAHRAAAARRAANMSGEGYQASLDFPGRR